MKRTNTSSTRLILSAIGLPTLLTFPALAQEPALTPGMPMHQGMPGMTMPNRPMPGISGADSPSTNAFKAANDKMMQGMNAPVTGDADQHFVAGMIPHHAGAIDMAKIELQFCKDPKLLALAKSIIAAQKKEIAKRTA